MIIAGETACVSSRECIFDRENITVGVGVCIQGICECGENFGWKGEACNEISSQVLILRVILSVIIFLFIAVLIFSIKYTFAVVNLDLESDSHSTYFSYEKKKKVKQEIFVIVTLTGLGSLCILIYEIFNLRGTIDPALLEHSDYISFIEAISDDKLSIITKDYEKIIYFETIGYVLLSLASYALVSLVIQILEAVMSFSRDKAYIWYLVKFNEIFDIFMTLAMIVAIILVVFHQIDLLYIGAVTIDFGLMLLLIIGRVYMRRIFAEFKTTQELAKNIKRVTRNLLVAYLVIFLVYVLIIFVKEDILLGDVHLFAIISVIASAAFLWLGTTNILYSRNALSNANKNNIG